MFKLCAKVEISGDRSWTLDFVTAVEITRDTEKLTTEAKITLPKKMKWDGSADICPVATPCAYLWATTIIYSLHLSAMSVTWASKRPLS